MEVDRYYFGWRQAFVGSFVFDVTSDGNTDAYTITISSGTYFHDLDDGVTSGYDSFAVVFKSALSAARPGGGTWTVTFSNATLAYTITDSVGNFAATLNAVAQRTLGMASPLAGAASQVSTVRPYYVIAPNIDAVSQMVGPYQPRTGIVAGVSTLSGRQAGIGSTVRPTHAEWVQRHETLAATHAYAASGSVPWTWEHAFNHVGLWEPFVLVDSLAASPTYASDVVARCKLLEDGAAFEPEREEEDIDNRWRIPFLVVIEERP